MSLSGICFRSSGCRFVRLSGRLLTGFLGIYRLFVIFHLCEGGAFSSFVELNFLVKTTMDVWLGSKRLSAVITTREIV